MESLESCSWRYVGDQQKLDSYACSSIQKKKKCDDRGDENLNGAEFLQHDILC